MKLSIVLPIYNSEKIILSSLKKIKYILEKNKINYEILFRNDFSKDNSALVLKKIKDKNVRIFFNDSNKGLGYTLRRLFKDAKGDVIIYLDVDMSFDVSMIPNFLEELKKQDVIVASKYLGYERKIPFYRIFASRVYYLINKILFNIDIKDIGSGFVMFKKEVLDKTKFNSNSFGIHMEMFYKIKKNGFKIKEIPVSYIHNDSVGSFSILKHGPKTLFDTFKLWFYIRILKQI